MLRYSITDKAPIRRKRLTFGLLLQEVERISVVRVTETTLYYRGLPPAEVLDPLMGSVDRRHLCASCMRDAKSCQGHPGHIVLSYPVFHIGFLDTVVKTLRTLCFGCSRVCMTEDERTGLKSLSRNGRLQHAQSVLRNRKVCPHCGMPRPHFSRSSLGISIEWGDASFESSEEEEFLQV